MSSDELSLCKVNLGRGWVKHLISYGIAFTVRLSPRGQTRAPTPCQIPCQDASLYEQALAAAGYSLIRRFCWQRRGILVMKL
jgi:hypothetical protein